MQEDHTTLNKQEHQWVAHLNLVVSHSFKYTICQHCEFLYMYKPYVKVMTPGVFVKSMRAISRLCYTPDIKPLITVVVNKRNF